MLNSFASTCRPKLLKAPGRRVVLASAEQQSGRLRDGCALTPQHRAQPPGLQPPIAGMAAGRLNEEQLMDELLGDDDTETPAHEGSPPKRPKSGSHHRHHSSKSASANRPHPESPAAEERSQGPAASQGGAGSGLAAEAAAVFSRLSASSSGSPVGARAAAEAAAAFAVGNGPAQPPGTIHPGASLAPSSPTSGEVWFWA
jgi:hypothetical protein